MGILSYVFDLTISFFQENLFLPPFLPGEKHYIIFRLCKTSLTHFFEVKKCRDFEPKILYDRCSFEENLFSIGKPLLNLLKCNVLIFLDTVLTICWNSRTSDIFSFEFYVTAYHFQKIPFHTDYPIFTQEKHLVFCFAWEQF